MSVINTIFALLDSGSYTNKSTITVDATDDFRAKLVMGDIIKGKVMRQYENGKYGVAFQGKEHIVDSEISLRLGEQLKAKVISVSEKIHLQRLADLQTGTTNQLSALPDDIKELLTKFNVVLTSKEVNVYQQLLKTTNDTKGLSLATVLVKKIGLPLNKEAVFALHEALVKSRVSTVSVGPAIVSPTKITEKSINSGEVVQSLAMLLSTVLNRFINKKINHQGISVQEKQTSNNTASARDKATDSATQDNTKQFGEWLLNIQHNGSVNHRTFRLPVWFDDEMLEVDMALFSEPTSHEKQTADEKQALLSQKATISISPQFLGKLDIEVSKINRHLSIRMFAEKETTAEVLSSHLAELSQTFRQKNWFITEIQYKQQVGDDHVYRSVVEHHLNKDSLSQLL